MGLCDRIGRGHRLCRRQDPRIAASILRAEQGVTALWRDLTSGVWHRRYGGLLRGSTLGLGYRLAVA
jgi:hypothetical protein